MSDPVERLARSVKKIARFSGKNLTSKITELEFKLTTLKGQQIAELLNADSIDEELLEAARSISALQLRSMLSCML
jgi:hypothetical protein